MKRSLLVLLSSVLVAAQSFAQPVVDPGPVDLFVGTSKASSHDDLSACVGAAEKLGPGSYGCRNITRVTVEKPLPIPPKSITYFSDCGPGAEPSCVAGSNLNPGTSPTAPKQTPVGFSVRGREAGEHVFAFARGSSVGFVALYYPKNYKNPDQQLVYKDYTPAWSKTKALPILKFVPAPGTTNNTGITLIGGGDGYTFQNLDLVGPGAPAYIGTALFLYRTVANVLVDNVTFREWGIGMNVSHDGAAQIRGVTVRNSRFLNNAAQGWLGSGHDTLLENNVFDNNGFKTTIRYHNIYLSGKSNNVVVRGNKLTRNAIVDGKCTAVSMVGHGQFTNLLIEGNTIIEPSVGWGCYGIQMNGYQSSTGVYFGFDGTIIRNNLIAMEGTTGSLGIGVNACPNCVIEGNTLVGKTVGSFIGIAVPDGSFTSPGSKDNAVTIRNNRLYIESNGADVTAIRANAAGATGDRVTGNVTVFGPTTTERAACVVTRPDLATYAALSDNPCHRGDAAAKFPVPTAANGWEF